MAQNLVTLFGSEGAERFLELLDSPYRQPAWQLHALAEDGSVAFDLTAYLSSFSSSTTDEVQSHSASFSLANPGGRFDRYGGEDATALAEGRILRFRKGLVDPVDGTLYLLPAFYGRIIQGKPSYTVSGDNTISVTVADELKDPVRQRVTSPAYENTQANLIATDVLQRWGKFPIERIKLADLDRIYPFAEFPDMLLIDCLKTLFDSVLFWIRANEAGEIETGPRLGSALSSLANIKGYPDQITAPPSEAIAYTFPDEPGVESIDGEWQNFDGAANQVKVIGKAEAAQERLGPVQELSRLPASSVGRTDQVTQRYSFSDPAGTQNSIIARNVYVDFKYSTDHELDTDPETAILSLMVWRDAWIDGQVYRPGDAVSYGGLNYACTKEAGSAHPPTDVEYWHEIEVAGPFSSTLDVYNSDPRRVGFVQIKSVTDGEIVLQINGISYSSGSVLDRRKHGGFDFKFVIYGQPVLSFSRSITVYSDYDVQTVEEEELADAFSDGLTFQAPHAPFAMSVPVEVFRDAVSLGKISADQTELSGDTSFGVDFERGRIVLKDLAYRQWRPDRDDTSPGEKLSTGGEEGEVVDGFEFNIDALPVPAPQEMYGDFRLGDCYYTFDGLVVGQGYDIRLHFADPTSTDEGQRKFSVFANGRKVIEGVDIVARAGATFTAIQETVTGVAPDSSGEIVVWITQHDPVSDELLPECSVNGDGTGGALGQAIICGIEILLPQGQGADPFAVNCGGDELTGEAAVITASYGYSPLQQIHGIQTYTIDDPLIPTYEGCQQVADFWTNFLAWQRHRQNFRAASVPHLQPGDLVKFYNPRLNADLTCYLQQIGRSTVANGADADSFSTYLIHIAPRS